MKNKNFCCNFNHIFWKRKGQAELRIDFQAAVKVAYHVYLNLRQRINNVNIIYRIYCTVVLHLLDNTCDQKCISDKPNTKAQCFRTDEMTSFFEQAYKYFIYLAKKLQN